MGEKPLIASIICTCTVCGVIHSYFTELMQRVLYMSMYMEQELHVMLQCGSIVHMHIFT